MAERSAEFGVLGAEWEEPGVEGDLRFEISEEEEGGEDTSAGMPMARCGKGDLRFEGFEISERE